MARKELLEKLLRLQDRDDSNSLPDAIPAFPTYERLIEKFRSELEKVGGVFLDGRSESLLQAAFEEILSEHGSDSLYWEQPAILKSHGLTVAPFEEREGTFSRSLHPEGRVTLPLEIESVSRQEQPIEEIKISVGSAVAGVAETGSVLIRSGSGRGRLLSILPPIHVALLHEEDLEANSCDWLQEADLGKPVSARLLITGPSRTADIEKTLIIGVHGPQHFYVILTR